MPTRSQNCLLHGPHAVEPGSREEVAQVDPVGTRELGEIVGCTGLDREQQAEYIPDWGSMLDDLLQQLVSVAERDPDLPRLGVNARHELHLNRLFVSV